MKHYPSQFSPDLTGKDTGGEESLQSDNHYCTVFCMEQAPGGLHVFLIVTWGKHQDA